MQAEVDGNTRTFTIGLDTEGTVQIDWGNGEKVTSEVIPAFDGWNQVNVYGTVSGDVYCCQEIISNVQSCQFGTLADINACQLIVADGQLLQLRVLGQIDGCQFVGIGSQIYGDNIVYFECSSRVDGAQILSLDVTKATALKDLTAMMLIQRFSNISERWLLLMRNVRCYKMWSNV